MTPELFEAVTTWQEKTFTKATALSIAYHLQEEVKELISDIEANSDDRRLEYADCFLLLFGAAKADGYSYEDICNLIAEKFEIVKSRKWGEPDAKGVVKHIKE